MYILFTGAPGSKWSSVVKNIYWSEDIDHTDYSEARTYWHDADTPGRKHLMHIGAYWDPGMEFDVDDWDGPFSGTGKRIVKAHTFAHQLDKLTYPNYQHFENLEKMWGHIQAENKDTMQFIRDNKDRITKVKDNVDLCRLLEISFPDTKGRIHNYAQKGVEVYVYK
jgi:hypothetical protein